MYCLSQTKGLGEQINEVHDPLSLLKNIFLLICTSSKYSNLEV